MKVIYTETQYDHLCHPVLKTEHTCTVLAIEGGMMWLRFPDGRIQAVNPREVTAIPTLWQKIKNAVRRSATHTDC